MHTRQTFLTIARWRNEIALFGDKTLRVIALSFAALAISACGSDEVDPLVAKGNGAEIRQAVAGDAVVASTAQPSDSFAVVALNAVNEARAAGQYCGGEFYPPAGAVLWNDRIAHASLLESEWMQQTNSFGHAWPDGTRVGDRLDMAKYEWRHADENIAAGFRSVNAAIVAWIESPSHCRALMRQDVSESGMAVVPGEAGNDYVAYWTLVLAEPAASTPSSDSKRTN